MKPPYRSPKNNQWYTAALFWDLVVDTIVDLRQDFQPVFSLYDDKPGMINCRTTFVELGDVTGYKWAQLYLGDFEHFKVLMKSKWFRQAFEDWSEELNAKLLSEAIDNVRRVARSDNDSQALAAAKYLAERPWDKAKKGRPSKAEIDANLKVETRKATEEDNDMARIGLTVVK